MRKSLRPVLIPPEDRRYMFIRNFSDEFSSDIGRFKFYATPDEWVITQLVRAEPIVVTKDKRTLFGTYGSHYFRSGVGIAMLMKEAGKTGDSMVVVVPAYGDRVWPRRGCVMWENQ